MTSNPDSLCPGDTSLLLLPSNPQKGWWWLEPDWLAGAGGNCPFCPGAEEARLAQEEQRKQEKPAKKGGKGKESKMPSLPET